MKTLDKYIAKHFLAILVASNILSVALFLLVSVLSSLSSLMVKKDLSIFQIVQYFSYQIPQISYYAAPLSVLIGLLLTFGMLGQRSELTIMRVSGLNWWQLARWPFIISVVYAWLIYLVGGYLIPLANEKSKFFETEQINKETGMPGANLWVFDRSNPEKQFAIYMDLFLPGQNGGKAEARGMNVFVLDRDFFPVREIRAKRAYYLGGYDWLLFETRTFAYSRNSAPSSQRQFMMVDDFPVKPKNFSSLGKWPMELSLPELQSYIQNLKRSGLDVREFQVEYASRYSVPVACLILFALGLGITIRMRRPQGISLNMAWALLAAFTYFGIMAECLSLGKSGKLPPLLSAWVANFLFTGVAFYLLAGRERD